MSETPQELPQDENLWKILPTTFKDDQGRDWYFRKITVRDLSTLQEQGLSTEKILSDMSLVELATLSHKFLAPMSGQETPGLNDYLDLLCEDVVGEVIEAFRRCLTNFFPRTQRIAVRKMFRIQDEWMLKMAEKQSEISSRGNPMDSSDSPSTALGSLDLPPGISPLENSSSPATQKPNPSEAQTEPSEESPGE